MIFYFRKIFFQKYIFYAIKNQTTTVGTPLAVEEFNKAKEVAAHAHRVVCAAKERDMGCIAAEAVLAGFPEGCMCAQLRGGSDTDNSMAIRVSPGHLIDTLYFQAAGKIHWSFRTSKGYIAPVNAECIAKYGLSAEQVFFLEWSRDWESQIAPYWEGRAEFANVAEFIDSLKKNAEPVYSSKV